MRPFAPFALALLAGCGGKGVALDLTIKPNCVDDNNAVDHLLLDANLTPPGSAQSSVTIPGSSFFANVGVSNRLVLILPDATTHVDVSVTADDAGAHPIGFGEVGFAIDGPNVYPATLDLGNARCPAMMNGGSDGGPGGDGGAPNNIVFVAASGVPPTQLNTLIQLPQPPGAMFGDVLLAAISNTNSSEIITPPDGSWTKIDSLKTDTGLPTVWYVHVIASAEAGPYAFYFPSSRVPTGAIVAYRGVDTTTPIDTAASTGAMFMTQPYNLPPVPITPAAATVVAMFGHTLQGIQSTTTWTAPAGMTTRVAGQTHGAIAIFDQPVTGGTTFSQPAVHGVTADGLGNGVVEVVVLRSK